MTIHPFTAAQFICEQSGWSVTQLKLHKILYLGQMQHLGQYGEPLFYGDFEAWAYGPVLPIVYHKTKAFGAKPIRQVFHAREAIPDKERATLELICGRLLGQSAAQLVANTHWNRGAWAKHYRSAKNSVIPFQSIREEYEARG